MIERGPRNIKPLFCDENGRVWASDGLDILISTDSKGRSFERRAGYRGTFLQRLQQGPALVKRAFRSGFHGIALMPDGSVVVVMKGGILRAKAGSSCLELVHEFRYGGRPLNLCQTRDGYLFYGEYFGNQNREPVHVVGSFDNGMTWRTVQCFAAGEIRHVHGIHYDSYRQGCWILTGDNDQESRIYLADLKLEKLSLIKTGSQRCRAVTVIPCENGLVVPTDTEHEQNYIQWLDAEDHSLTIVREIPGTVFYSATFGQYKVISTVVEPSVINKLRYATLWLSKNGREWRQIYQQPKDMWSPVYFQYGTFVLPRSCSPYPHAFLFGQAVKHDDNHVINCDLDAAWEAAGG